MISIQRTDSKNRNFIELVAKLDADLGERDGEKHAFYHRFNNISTLNHTVVLFMDEKPVGCGALKAFDSKSIEVKRMYTLPEARGNGLATKILKELELWVTELGNKKCILETGKR
jgi:putative acetyltransferase